MAFHVDKQFNSKNGSSLESSNSDLDFESLQSTSGLLFSRKSIPNCNTISSAVFQTRSYSDFQGDDALTLVRRQSHEGLERPPLIGQAEDSGKDCKSTPILLGGDSQFTDSFETSFPNRKSADALPGVLPKSSGNLVQSKLTRSTNDLNLSKTRISYHTPAIKEVKNEAFIDVSNQLTAFLTDGGTKEQVFQTGKSGCVMSDEESGSKFFSSTKFADMKYDSSELRAPSPSLQSVSSIASTQRLEWDSGADIGYGGLKSMLNLSTLERMAIGSYCCAFMQMEADGDSLLEKNDADTLVPRIIKDQGIMPVDIQKSERGVSNDAKYIDTEKTNVLTFNSSFDRKEETEREIHEYLRHLELKDYEDNCLFIPDNESFPAKSEKFTLEPVINTGIMKTLNITEKRSSSMTDLSHLEDKKNCSLNNLKRIHSYSTSDMLQELKPRMTSAITSSNCSAISQNSSNTVVGNFKPNLAPMCSNCVDESELKSLNYQEQSTALQSCKTGITTTKNNVKNTICSSPLMHLHDKYINTEVTMFVKTFLNELCWNSEGARRQRLLKKIIEDFGISLCADEIDDKLSLIQNVKQRDTELHKEFSSPQVPLRITTDDGLSATQLKQYRLPVCNAPFLSPIHDVGGSCAQFCMQQHFFTGNGNTEELSSTDKIQNFSSSSVMSTFWKEIPHLEDTVSLASSSPVESPETNSEYAFCHNSSVVNSEIQKIHTNEEVRPKFNRWNLSSELKQIKIEQPENLQSCNIQSLQNDIIWLEHIETLLHTKKSKLEQIDTCNAKYFLQDFNLPSTFCKGRNKLRSFVTKVRTKPSSRARVLVQLSPPVISDIPANNDKLSVGIQTSFVRSEATVFPKPSWNENCVESSWMTTPSIRSESQCMKQNSAKNNIFDEHLTSSVAYFLPLNDNQVDEFSSSSKDLRIDYNQKNLLNRKSKKIDRKFYNMNPSQRNNKDVSLVEPQVFRKYTIPISISSQHHNPNYRRISPNEMRAQTEKVYKALPEVTTKNDLKQKAVIYKTNRLMAQMYKKVKTY